MNRAEHATIPEKGTIGMGGRGYSRAPQHHRTCGSAFGLLESVLNNPTGSRHGSKLAFGSPADFYRPFRTYRPLLQPCLYLLWQISPGTVQPPSVRLPSDLHPVRLMDVASSFRFAHPSRPIPLEHVTCTSKLCNLLGTQKEAAAFARRPLASAPSELVADTDRVASALFLQPDDLMSDRACQRTSSPVRLIASTEAKGASLKSYETLRSICSYSST